MNWQKVTESVPDSGDYPVTVVRSMERGHAVWRKCSAMVHTLDEKPLTPEERNSVMHFFEQGELVTAETWYPQPS